MDTPLVNGLFVFILGLLVVFAGMLIIVLAVQLFGKIMNKPKEKVKDVNAETVPQPVATVSEEIPDHIKAAIVAVISAYYFESKSSCDFVVKKIKRI